MPPLTGDAHPRAIGPKMRDLRPQHRAFVVEYCLISNAVEAYRRTILSAGAKGTGANVNAVALMARQDIAEAVHEESVRRMAVDLPVSISLMKKLARGEGGKSAKAKPVPYSVQQKAIAWLGAKAGLADKVQVEHSGQVGVTIDAQWEQLARMAAARGDDPARMLANIPEAQRAIILGKLDGRVSDAEFEEVA